MFNIKRMNKRGGLFDIFIVLIVLFIVLIFFAGFIYGWNALTDNVITAANQNPNVPGNVTKAAEDVFGKINTALPALQWVGLALIVAMILGIMVSNFLVKAHPAFFVIYILITIVAVIFSVSLSNAYQSILTTDNPITTNLQQFTALNHIMLNLPIWTTIIGFAGAIFLFLGITVDRQAGGGVDI